MHVESSLESQEFIEAELSKEEEHILQMLEDLEDSVIWVNRTQKGIMPGTLDFLKNYYTNIESSHILESLVRKRMLDRVDNGILLLCPSCGNHEASIVKSCPSCGSIKLRQRRKIVHAPCEHWGTFEEFNGGNTITCPVCHESIETDRIRNNKTGFSYSDPYYECQECGFSANRVQRLFICKSCKRKYNETNAVHLEQTGFMVAVEPIAKNGESKRLALKEQVHVPEEVETQIEIATEPTKENLETEPTVKAEKEKEPKNKRKSLRLLDELEKLRSKREKTNEQAKEKIEPAEKPAETQRTQTRKKPKEVVVKPQRLEIKQSSDTEPAESNEPAPEKADPIEPMVEVEMDPEPEKMPLVEEKSVKNLESEPIEEDVDEPKHEPEEVIVSEPEEVIVSEPEEDSYKVLFVVENQMVCNFVLEGLQESKEKIELNLVEDGSKALKALRRVYDLIIIDSDLKKIDPSFLIDEMGKWKIKSPVVLIDEGTLKKIPKELNVVKKVKRKQRDLRNIKKTLSNHL